jgi:hypothetical protein
VTTVDRIPVRLAQPATGLLDVRRKLSQNFAEGRAKQGGLPLNRDGIR